MDKEISVLLAAMRAAGAAILALQKSDLLPTKKSNNTIVTQADLLANDILRTHLLSTFTADGWLSEETVDENHRLHCRRVWIVDPIDGTKEYASGIPEYAISVALVEKGVPILSAIFNPAKNELFHAVSGKGAWLNDKKIYCRKASSNNFFLLASRTEYQRGEWRSYQQNHKVMPVGSIAYKLALVAAGNADATFSLGPKHEWDIAAGVLLVTEAGGIVTNKNKEKFIFNRIQPLINGVIASAAEINDLIFQLIAPRP